MFKSFLGIVLKCSPIYIYRKSLKECTRDYLLSVCVYIGTKSKRIQGEIFYFYTGTGTNRVQTFAEVEMSLIF